LASIQGDKGKPSAWGSRSGPHMAVIVNPNINQLLSEHDSVTLVVKTPTKIIREHRQIFMETKYGVRKHSSQES
jgi:hypothetical protein